MTLKEIQTLDNARLYVELHEAIGWHGGFPNVITSLDRMQVIERTMPVATAEAYSRALEDVVYSTVNVHAGPRWATFKVQTATARQRAEAFLLMMHRATPEQTMAQKLATLDEFEKRSRESRRVIR